MGTIKRKEILDRLKEQNALGKAIIGVNACMGLTAKCVDRGGADFITVSNEGYFRRRCRHPYGAMIAFDRANDNLLQLLPEFLAVVEDSPILAGVCANDPYVNWSTLLPRMQEMGVSGIQNSISVGMYDLQTKGTHEKLGIGYSKEVELIHNAHNMDMFTAAYCWDEAQAARMAAAGADVLIANMRYTCPVGRVCVSAELDETIDAICRIESAAHAVNTRAFVLCYGGPINSIEIVQYVLSRSKGIAGYFGGSIIEGIPALNAIIENGKRFKEIKIEQD